MTANHAIVFIFEKFPFVVETVREIFTKPPILQHVFFGAHYPVIKLFYYTTKGVITERPPCTSDQISLQKFTSFEFQ